LLQLLVQRLSSVIAMASTLPNRLNYLVQLMQRAIAKKITQEQYWADIARYEYSEEELQAALNQFKAIASEQATVQNKRVASKRETVTDPIAGPVSTPDWALSSEVHALGQKIAEVSTRFKQQITYVPERSLKSIRVKRLFFAPEPDTDLGKFQHFDITLWVMPGCKRQLPF
jgi:DNA anti-recombination protein RmuC